MKKTVEKKCEEAWCVCRDCNHEFEEGLADNASLCHDEFNPACPKCGSDWVESIIN